MKERNALVRKCIVSTALVTVLGSITQISAENGPPGPRG